jgi:hypothetical protein
MAPDIEAESAIFDGSRKPAYIAGISFENFCLIAVAGELVAGGQTGWPGADDDDPMMMLGIGQKRLPAKALGTPASNRESRSSLRPLKISTNSHNAIEHTIELRSFNNNQLEVNMLDRVRAWAAAARPS